MKITLIGNYINDQQQSMLRFAEMMRVGLMQHGHDVKVWYPPVHLGNVSRIQILKKWLAYIDKYILARRSFERAVKDADVVHILDHSNAMYGAWIRKKSWVITCHDLLAIRVARGEFPPQRTNLSGRVLQHWILSSLKKAPQFICVSETTKLDLQRLIPKATDRTKVIWNGLNTVFQHLSPTAASERINKLFECRRITRPNRYIFHIGGTQWYKNRTGVLFIFSELIKAESSPHRLKLVMAGKPPTPKHLANVNELGLKEDVIWLENVSSKDLETLYNGAACLLFPSLAEGFGWPVIEALACGCPVVTSNRAPMTEIAGADTLFIDPEDAGQSAKQIAVWLKTSEMQLTEQVQSRCQHAEKFSAQSMISSYAESYHEYL